MTAWDESATDTMASDGTGSLGTGSRLAGRYVIERLLGRGGMGSVHAVFDAELGERVALKLLEHTRSDDAVQRFRQEVRLSRRVTHRNVARIFDIGEHRGTHFLTMELVEGGSLHSRMAGHPMAVGVAANLALQVARGLAAAHEAGIVHRDLKPGNVLVDAAGRAVITDFGIACALAGDVRLTVEGGAWLGTPAYMAPEQVKGVAIDARSDVYALGVMFFELLTGKLPFVADNPLALALARLDRAPIDPSSIVLLPDELTRLVLDCLAAAPDARPSSVDEFIERLLALDVVGAALADRRETLPAAAVRTPPATARAVGTTGLDPARTRTPTSAGFAPVPSTGRTIAVLPFRYRGPSEEAYLAEALSDELIDLLSRTRGLRVIGRGSTAGLDPNVDPRMLARDLGVDTLIDGTVQRGADGIRISARLVDASTGVQTWSDRFDGKLGDVFELQDRVAKRVAETLRVELFVGDLAGDVPAEAIELYLRGRAALRRVDAGGDGSDGAIALLERALAIAPHFKAAIATRAVAAERTWFVPSGAPAGRRERAERAVAEALEHAPGMPETHLAAARLAMQQADYKTAAAELVQTLAIAPTFAAAHEVLGSLQCEAGRAVEGIRHIRLAYELDPVNSRLLIYEARYHELRGDSARADAVLAELAQRDDARDIAVVGLRARIASWRGDRETLLKLREGYDRVGEASTFVDLLFATYFDDVAHDTLLDALRQRLHALSPRFRALVCQLAAETAGVLGRPEVADEFVGRAVDDTLMDVDWLEHCPVLAPVRALPSYPERIAKVRARAESLWHIA